MPTQRGVTTVNSRDTDEPDALQRRNQMIIHHAAVEKFWRTHEVVGRETWICGKAYMWVRNTETRKLSLLRDRVRDGGISVG
jgi:hypothetical protein